MSTDWTRLDEVFEGVLSRQNTKVFEGVLSRQNTEIGVSIISSEQESWEHKGNIQFPSASTAKIPIMIQIYRLIDRGELALDDIHILQAVEKSNGSGVLRHMHSGLQLSLGDLLYLMMSISDNTATNILIELAGMDNINATMQELGMVGSILGRPMQGRLAIAGEQENLATANDYTRVMCAINDDVAASPASCTAMITTLEKQQNRHRIGRYVPKDDNYRWGSKTGTNNGIVNDVGFVSSSRGTIFIAIYCRGVEDEVAGEQLIADIARSAMQVTGLLD